MIRFLNPGFAWALAVPAAIIVLYLLRRRYLPKEVPSVFLWRRSVRDYAANRPFQRLMKNALLPLQVLAALAAALALMNPVIPGGKAGRSILIFDISGSMQAESGGLRRLELAKEEALRRISRLPAEEKITVLTAGDEVQRAALEAGREEAEKAIASIECGRGGADIGRALRLAEALAGTGEEQEGAAVTVFSDALRVSDLQNRSRGSVPAIVNVGGTAENRAVYSLTAEPGKAYARAANFGAECTVSLTCEADGVLCGAKEVTIPAGGTAGVSFEIPGDANEARVSLREKDALEADNTAAAAVKRGTGLRVAVTEDSVFLESALKVRPEVTVIRTGAEALAGTEADLYIPQSNPLILTKIRPEEVPEEGTAAFGGFTWAEEAKTGEHPAAEVWESPLTEGVTMKDVFFRSWRPVSGGRTAVSLGEDPVIAWTEDTAVLGFDLHETNLPLKYDFPVLIQNILNTLAPEEETAKETEEGPMPLAESDTRDTAPNAETETDRAGSEQGRELKGMLLALFLMLLAAEMGVSRYVS